MKIYLDSNRKTRFQGQALTIHQPKRLSLVSHKKGESEPKGKTSKNQQLLDLEDPKIQQQGHQFIRSAVSSVIHRLIEKNP